MKRQLQVLLTVLILITLQSFYAVGQQPTITSFSPILGDVGSTVTITGTNFNNTPANNVVFFGSTMATPTSATTTSLSVVVPSGASFDNISVTDISTGLTAYSSSKFSPTFPNGEQIINSSFFTPPNSFSTGTEPFYISVKDLDADGKSDIIVVNYLSNTLSIYHNTSVKGTISFAVKVDISNLSWSKGLVVNDLDGDGKPDITTIDNLGNVRILLNTSSSGTISFAAAYNNITASDGGSDIKISDIDGDGKPEICVLSSISVNIYKNKSTIGSLSFNTAQSFAINGSKLEIGDLDGDNKPDLVVTSGSTYGLYVLRNTSSSGTISFNSAIGYISGSRVNLALGDIDGDSKLDVVIDNNSGVRILRNTSTVGTIMFDIFTLYNFPTANAPADIKITDIDGDGLLDIAISTNTSETYASLLKNKSTIGTIDFANKVDIDLGPYGGSYAMFCNDLDGDGKPDIGITGLLGNNIYISHNVILPPTPTITSFSPTSAKAGDTVTITGTYLKSTSILSFGGTPATSFTVLSATTIQAVVGFGTSGDVSLSTLGGDASKSGFTYIPVPTITSFTPTEGQHGSTITIYGTNFTSTTSVSFGGVNAASFTVISSTEITAFVGTGASGDIAVTTPYGTATKSGFIYKLSQNITFASLSNVTYGSADFDAGATASSSLPVSYSSSNTSVATIVAGQIHIIGAGSTTISADQSGDATYAAAPTASQSLQVVGYPVTVTVSTNQTKTYGDSDPTLNYSNSALLNSDIITGTLSRVIGENVGKYKITQGSLTAGNNYVITIVSDSLEIKPKAITVTADAGQSIVYGDIFNLSYTVTPSLIIGDSFTGRMTISNQKIGKNVILLNDLSAGSNYNLTYVSDSLTLTPYPLTITVDASQSKQYSDSDPTFTITLSHPLFNEDYFTGSMIRDVGEDVGYYTIYQGTLDAGNFYTITFINDNFEIKPKDITVTADANQTKIFGDSDPIITYTPNQALANGNSFSGSLSRNLGENVGNYLINQGDLDAGSNYNINFVADTFRITKAIQDIYFATLDAVNYGKNPFNLSASGGDSFNPVVFTSSDPTVATCSGANGKTITILKAGSTTITATQAGNSNYLNANPVSQTLIVNPKPITVTANASQTKVYGTTDPSYTYSVSPSLVGTDTFTGSLTRVAGENEGNYTINQGTLSAGANYAITYVGDNFTISPKPITVTVNSGQSKVYGATDPTLSYTFSPALIGIDAFTGSLTRLAGENIGNYSITQGTLSLGANYAITFVGDNLTISAKPITVTVNVGQTKIYGATDPTFTYSVSPALIGSDIFTGSLTRVVGENIGNYTINQGTLDAGSNYTLTYVSKNFAISAKPITVTADAGQTKVYGASDPTFTYSVSPALIGSDVFTGSLTRVVGENAGNYAINQGSLSAGSNYAITYVNNNFAISAKPITVTPNNQTKIYGESDPLFTYSVSPALLNSDVLSGSLSRVAGINVGKYAIIIGSLANSNYAITLANDSLSITSLAITVTANSNQSKMIGNSDPIYTYSVNPALVYGDILSGSLTRVTGESIGTYAIQQGTLVGGNNYTVTFVGSNFSITPVKPEYWGMTYYGGNGNGEIFKTDTIGQNIKVVKGFPENPGGNPSYTKLTEYTTGKLYGVNSIGGAKNYGVLFMYDPSNGTYTNLIDFDNTNTGKYPNGRLVLALNGKLYGSTTKGGSSGYGLIFEYDPTTNICIKKIDLNSTTGYNNYGGLSIASNGKIYGLTYGGGTSSNGTLFEYDPITNTLTKKIDFNGTTQGGYPNGTVFQASNGKLYGLTQQGGANSVGVIFEYDINTSTFTKKYDFAAVTTSGMYPFGGFIQANNGKLYAQTYMGGVNNLGAIIEYDITGNTVTKKFDFDGSNSGKNPEGDFIEATNDKLLGLTYSGGSKGNGVLFEFDINSSTFSKKVDFDAANLGKNLNGTLIKTTLGKVIGVANSGGMSGYGTIFDYNYAGNTITKTIDFNNTSNGDYPYGSFVKASDGYLYGTNSYDGQNYVGTLFKIDPSTNILTKIVDFGGANGGYPYEGLTVAANGKLYGTTSSDGADGNGTIYEYDPNLNTFTVRYNFTTATGYLSESMMTLAPNGKLYGTTNSGGANDQGVIFEYDPITNTYIDEVDFDGTNNGGYPVAGLTLSNNGKMYGVTSSGGLNGDGCIFEYNFGKQNVTKVFDFSNNTSGSSPMTGLTLASNGKMYGMTYTGGANNYSGTLYEFDQYNYTFTKKVDFGGAINGSQPYGGLMNASNGKIYGLTSNSTNSGKGVVFEYDPKTNTYTERSEFNGANGNQPYYTHLKEINAPISVVTGVASNVLATTATITGTVTNIGDGTYTERGICYGTTHNPTFTDNVSMSNNGLGEFVDTLKGLTTGVTYYCRAFVTNDIGQIAFGNEISFNTKQAATIILTDLDKVYNGSSQTPTVTTSPLGLNVVLTYNGNSSAPSDAGNYTIVATINDVTYGGTATYTMNIAQVPLTVIGLKADNKQYDGTLTANISSTGLSGILNSDDVSLGYVTASFDDGNVGTNKNITISSYNLQGTTASNYSIVLPSNLLANITPLNITVTADPNQAIAYGDLLNLTYSVNPSLLGGDSFTGSLIISNQKIGKNIILLNDLSAGSNYNITYVADSLTISPLPITITVDAGQSKEFGDSDPIFSYSLDHSLINGDNFTGTLSRVAGEGVNSYTIIQGTLSASNFYTITFISNNFDITPKTITVTPSPNQTKKFGEDDPTFTYTINPVVPITGNLSRDLGEAIGDYFFNQGDLDAGSNYYISLMSDTFKITKATQEIYFANLDAKNYGASTFNLSASGGDSFNPVVFTSSDPSVATCTGVNGQTITILKVGTTTITANQTGNSNYLDASPVSQILKINPKPITVTADASQSKVYGASDPTFTYSVSSALVGTDTFTGSLTRVAGENTSSYAINLGTLDAGTNYSITYVSKNFDITTKAITVTADASQTKVYGATDPTFTYTVSPALVGTDAITGSLARIAGENIGSYAINQGTLDAGTNYSITYVSKNFDISTKAITVTADASQTKVYGATDPTFNYTISPALVGTDVFTGSLTRVAGENIGTYAINQGSLDAGANYTINYVGKNFTVTAKPITVTADASQNKVYGATDPTYTYSVSPALIGSDVFIGSLVRIAGENIGSYAINQGTLDAGANYTITYTSKNFDISAKPITVTTDASQSKVYGTTDPTFTYTISPALIGSDVLTGSLARTAGENTGSYAINQGTLDAGANYTITYVSKNFIVTAKPITVTADASQTKVYGTTDPTFTYSVSPALVGSDLFTGSLARIAGENVGSYAINQGTLDAGSNYSVTYIGKNFDLSAKAITVTVDASQTKEYGDADPIFTYSVSPALIGTDVFTGTLSRVAGENIGSYTINQGTLDVGSNYTVSFVNKTFEISQKSITITADAGQYKQSGDSDPIFTYSISPSLSNGDVFTGAISRTSGESVGSYSYSIGTLSAGTNYSLTMASNPMFNIYGSPSIVNFTPNTAGKNQIVTITGTNLGGVNAVSFGGTSAKSFTISPTSDTIYAVVDNGTSGSVKLTTPYTSVSMTGFTYFGVSIVSSQSTPICPGTAITYSANTVNAGSNPIYQWNVNGANVGTSSNTYTNSNLSNNDSISCKLSIQGNPDYDVDGITGNPYNSSASFTSTSANTGVGYRFTTGNGSVPSINQIDIDLVEWLATNANHNFNIAITGVTGNVPNSTVLATDAVSAIIGNYGSTKVISFTSNLIPNISNLNLSSNTSYCIVVYNGDNNIALARTSLTTNYIAKNNFTFNNAVRTGSTTTNGFRMSFGKPTIINSISSNKLAAQIKPQAIITSFTPISASSGQSITITGTNLDCATGVKFGGTNATTFSIVDANTITAIVDTGATGNVDVTTHDITATKSGFTFIAKQHQTITFNALISKVYGDASYTVSAIGGASGNVVTFTSSNPSIATCSGTNGATISILKTGTVTISAHQLGNGLYYAADSVSQTLTINSKPITITADASQSKVYGTTDPTFTYSVSPALVGTDGFTGSLTRVVGENIGSYAINQGTLDAGTNYTITYVSKNFDITTKPITVTADASQTKVYGATDPTFTYTVSPALVGSDVFTGNLTRIAGENIGSYAINQGTLDASANYSITYVGKNFTVTAKAITVTADASQAKVYGTTDPTFTYSTSPALVGSDVFTGSLARIAGENIGSYAINQGTLDAGANYSITYVGKNFTVTAKAITVTADASQAKVYGVTDPTYTYSVSPALVGTDVFTGTLTRVAGENIGSYAINQGTLDAGTNYSITYVSKNFDITAKAITVTADASQTKVYGTTDPTLTYSVSPALIGTDAFTGSLTRVAGENIGLYAINKGTLDAGTNYTITYVSKNFDITAKPITVTANTSQSKVYGTTDPTFTYTVSPALVGTDAFTGSLTRIAGENIGSYAINKGTLDAGTNYSITYVSKNFDITAKTITVTADASQTKVYGTTDPSLTYTVSPALVGSDVFTGNLTRIAGENIGSYAINKGTLDAGANYTITYVSKNFTVTAKPITVTADASQTKVYGVTDPTFTYSVSPALVGTDVFTGTLTRVAGENIGSYAINQGTLDAGTNYTITYVSKNFDITAKPITVTANTSQSKVYGTTDPTLTYSVSPALIGTDVFTGSLSRIAGENIGSYAINKGTLDAGTNYSITYVSKNFDITAKAITVTADASQTKVYGTTDPTFTYTVSPALVGADAFTGSLVRIAGENIGSYSINKGTLDAGANYTITYVSKNFTVTAKTITVTADASQSKVYGTTDPTFTYSVSPALIGTDVFTGNLTRIAGENNGLYAINQGTLDAGANYTIFYVGKNFTVTAKAITVTADASQTKVYGTTDPTFTYSASPALVGSDVFTGSLARIAGENIGSYAINQGTLDAGANYSITYVGKNFTVTAKAITVTADASQTKVYGVTDPTYTYTVSPALVGTDVFTGSLMRVVGENIGSYAINQGTLDAGTNYTITYISKNFDITAKPITVTADASQSKVYGTTDPTFTYTVSPALIGTDAITGSLTRVVGENIGSYAINKGTLDAGTNYSITYVSKNFDITAKAITVTANASQTKVYGATDPTFTYTVSPALVGSDVFTGTLARIAGENIGSYAINQASLDAGTNYTITYVSKNFDITVKPITVASDASQTKVYGTTDPILTYTVSPALVGSDTFTGSLMRVAGENIGKYSINQGSLDAGSNYTITYVADSFVISKKAITITIDALQSKVYGATDQTFSYTVNPALVGTDTFTGSLVRVPGENIGKYNINQGTLDAGSNYNVTFVTDSFAITSKAITVTADANQTKVYGTSDQVFTYTVSPALVGTDVFTGSLTRLAGENIGSYAINQGTLDAGSNYTITYVSKNFDITAKPITVTADASQTKVYGTSDQVLTYSVSPALIGSDTFTGTLNRATGENIGKYIINQGTLVAGSNYTITYVADSFAITTKAITVTVDASQTKVYGTTDPTFTYIVSPALVGSDVFTGNLIRIAGENIGKYIIKQGTLDAGSNYSLTYVTDSFAITTKAITVTADAAQTKVYGATEPIFTYTVSPALIGSDTFTGTLARTIGENVGKYKINQGSLSAGSNYSLTYVADSFAITKAALTITSKAQTKVYGTTDPTLTYVINGYVNGDDETSLLTAVSINRTSGENAGKYAITSSGATSNNYQISFIPDSLTITKATIYITANSATRIYGDANPTFTVTASGFVGNETASVIDVLPTASTTASLTSSVSKYLITPNGGSDNNYYFNYIADTLYIIQRDLTATAIDTSMIYGNTKPTFQIAYSGFVNGDNASVIDQQPIATCNKTNAGLYTISLSGGMDNNYSISLVDGKLKINKRELVVTAVDTFKYEFEAHPDFRLIYKGFINGDDESVMIKKSVATCKTGLDATAGTYPIEFSITGTAANYYVKTVDGTLTIKPKTVGITITEDAIVNVYPNPTTDIVNIDLPTTEDVTISVVDMNGKTISRDVYNKKAIIDVSSFAKGVYIFNIQGQHSISSHRVIVQ